MTGPDTRTRGTVRLAAVAGAALTAGPLIFLVAEAVSAHAWRDPRYSYLTNWISDLGVPHPGTFQGRYIDSPLHGVMNAGFVASGVALLIGGLLLVRTRTLTPTGRARRGSQILSVLTAGGYVLVGTFHTSVAAAADGTIALHFAGAGLAILGGNALAVVLGLHWSKRSPTRGLGHAVASLGALGLLAVVVLACTATTNAPNGLIERIAVYTVLLWQLRVAADLGARALRQRRTRA